MQPRQPFQTAPLHLRASVRQRQNRHRDHQQPQVLADRVPLFNVISMARFGDARVIGKKVALAKVPLVVTAPSSTETSNRERANGKKGIYCEVSLNVAMG
jgi:hypothetical protein